MSAHDLLTLASPAVVEAIEAQDEDVTFGLTLAPGPDNGLQLLVSLWIRGPILGSHLNYFFTLQPMALFEGDFTFRHEQLVTNVREALEAARAMRSEQLNEQLKASLTAPSLTSPIPPN